MSNETKQEPRNALDDAHGCLDAIGGFYDGDQGRDDRWVRALCAGASAQIAIAEQLERLNDQLGEVIEPGRIDLGGRGHLLGFLRTVDPDA